MAAEQRETSAARLEWIDLYRGIAVLVMIETHVLNTFLAPGLRAAEGFAWVEHFNGLVAPAFLFIAGYVKALGRHRSRTDRSKIGRRLRRLAVIAAVGFVMHSPLNELAAHRWHDALVVGTRVNILPCLAVALAALVLVDLLAERARRIVVGGMVLLVLLLGPIAADWMNGPAPLLAWLNHRTGSLFPLFPWAAFAWCGWLLGAGSWTALEACALALASFVASKILAPETFSPASPAFFFNRLAWAFALVPVCQWIANRWLPRLVIVAGRESLAMYVAHLTFISMLTGMIVPALDLKRAALLYCVVLAATFAIAIAWRASLARRIART